MEKLVTCIVTRRGEAEALIRELAEAGFGERRISVLYPDDGDREQRSLFDRPSVEGTAMGAASGGMLGGMMGFLVGAGALMIPGLGLLAAAGPIAGMLAGAGAGVAVGGAAGMLLGIGIPSDEAAIYEARLQEGAILVAAHAYNEDEAEIARQLFEEHDTEHVLVSDPEALPDLGLEGHTTPPV